MNLSKLVAPFLLSSFAVVAGCAADATQSPEQTEQAGASAEALARSCKGLSTAACERTKGCMEKDEGCVVSCGVGTGCVTKCTTACAPLDCSALKNDECSTYAGSQCQLAKSCVVSCQVGTGCTTTCTDSCVPATVDCASLDANACAANGDRCQVVPGACVVSCSIGSGCVTKCAPSTCAPIH